MRILLLAALVSVPVMARADYDTAYKALRVFGKQQGEAALNRITELRGRNGVPQPSVWKITAADSSARGGVIEIEVQGGKIIAQRTPTARPAATMDLNQLNLDSDGAFTIADQEMRKAGIAFDRVDFVLRSAGKGQAPVWQLELFERGAKAAIIRIAADTGAIIDQQRLSGGQAHAPEGDRDYVDDGRTKPKSRAAGYSEPGQPFRGVDDFFHRLGKRFERRGHELKKFFGGD